MRLKIIAGNLVVVLLIGLVAFAVVRGQLKSGLLAGLGESVSGDSALLTKSWRLNARTFMDDVASQAATRQARDSFAGLDSEARRRRAHDASNAIARWFADPAREHGGAPKLVAIVDETGATVARNLDPNRTVSLQQLSALRGVLRDGVTRMDVWREPEEDEVLQVAMSRILSADGATLGALVVGYVLSDGIASDEAELLRRDVAFVTEDSICATSLARPLREQLDRLLHEDHKPQVAAALRADGSRSTIRVSFGGDTWIGVISPLPNTSSLAVASIVLANETKASELVSVSNIILMTTLLGMLFVLVYGAIIGNSLVKPLETIEEGVLSVINGQTDHRIDVDSPEFGGLAYRINQLINVFTGVEEEDDDGRLSGRPPAQANVWGPEEGVDRAGSPAAAVGGASSTGGTEPLEDEALASRIASEPEDAYYDRLFEEYVAAKTSIGESVANIPKERFIARLKKNSAALTAKHGSKDVRFQVEAAGNQVKLRPVIIR